MLCKVCDIDTRLTEIEKALQDEKAVLEALAVHIDMLHELNEERIDRFVDSVSPNLNESLDIVKTLLEKI